jgi:hypothetical protein
MNQQEAVSKGAASFYPLEASIFFRQPIFGDFSKILDSQKAKSKMSSKTGRIGVYFPRFWPVLPFLSTFSLC